MKYIKFFSLSKTILITTFLALSVSSIIRTAEDADMPPLESIATGKQPLIQINDKDLEALNLKGQDAQEFQQFVNAINNMSPEEQQFLQQLGQELETQMRTQGLDPSNPDDIFKWVEDQKTEQESGVGPKREEERPIKSFEAPEPCLEPITVVASPADARMMLQEIVNHLGLFRQKASTDDEMAHKLERLSTELNELLYYLNVLMQEDLIKHLTSKDFATLHKNLECFHNLLLRYEPTMASQQPKIPDVENPYEILEISYSATQAQIQAKFEKLKEKYDPVNISRKLDEQGITGNARKKQIKEARINFSFIQNAYDTLKDKKQRALLDRSLKDKIEQEKRTKAASLRAFNKLLDGVTVALYQHRVLADIEKLLQKYKPEEIAKAKKQEEIEKKVRERYKQPTKITPTPSIPGTGKDEYQQFYQQMQQSDWQQQLKSYAPSFPSFGGGFDKGKDSFGPGPKKDEGPKKPEDKKPGGGGGGGGKDEKKGEKGKEEGGGGAGGGAGGKPEAKPLTDQDVEKAVLINEIAKLLESTKDEIEIPEEKEKTKGLSLAELEELGLEPEEPEEPKKIKIPLKKITADLNAYLMAPPVKVTKAAPQTKEVAAAKNAVKNFMTFVKENKLEQLSSALGKLKPDSNPTLTKLWKDKVADKYGKKIQSWYNDIYGLLNLAMRHNNPATKAIDMTKTTWHGLDIPEASIKDIKKDIKPFDKKIAGEYPYLEKSSLAVPRKYLKDIYDKYTDLNKGFSAKK